MSWRGSASPPSSTFGTNRSRPRSGQRASWPDEYLTVDTSPLIFLAKLNRLDLLQRGTQEVFAPPAVLREISERQDEAARQVEEARRDLAADPDVEDRLLSTVLQTDLVRRRSRGDRAGSGACGAARIVLDDLDARRFADRLGLALRQDSGRSPGGPSSAGRSRPWASGDRPAPPRWFGRGAGSTIAAILQEAGEMGEE